MSFWQQIFEEYLFDNRIFTYLEKESTRKYQQNIQALLFTFLTSNVSHVFFFSMRKLFLIIIFERQVE